MARLMPCLIGLTLIAGEFAHAQNSLTVDILSPGEADYAGLPPGVLCIDIFGDWPNSEQWILGSIRGLAMGGARLRYAEDRTEANNPVLINPGLNNRYNTCFSRPLTRQQSSRFINAGVAVFGSYSPAGPLAVATAAEINVAYGRTGIPEGDPDDGYFGRVALDIATVPGAPPTLADWYAGPLHEAPGNAVFIFRSETPADGRQEPGTIFDTATPQPPYGVDWGVWFIPEPGACLLLLAGTGLVRILRGRAG